MYSCRYYSSNEAVNVVLFFNQMIQWPHLFSITYCIRWYHSLFEYQAEQKCVCSSTFWGGRDVMYASSGPHARVVRWDPQLLMVLTWAAQDFHQGAPPCNMLIFNGPLPVIHMRGGGGGIPRTLGGDSIICSFVLALLHVVFTFVQWHGLINWIMTEDFYKMLLQAKISQQWTEAEGFKLNICGFKISLLEC